MRFLSTLVVSMSVAVGPSLAGAQTCVVQTQLPGLGLGRSSSLTIATPNFATTWDADGAGPAPERLVMPRGAYLNDGVVRNNEMVVLGGAVPEFLPQLAGGSLLSATSVGSDLYALYIIGNAGSLRRWDGTQWQSVSLPAFTLASASAQIAESAGRVVLLNVNMAGANTAIYNPLSGSTVTATLTNVNAQLVETGGELYAIGSMTVAGVFRGIVRLDNNRWVTIDDNSPIRPSGASGVARDGSRLFATFFTPATNDAFFELTSSGWQFIAPIGSSLSVFVSRQSLITTPDGVLVVRDGAIHRYRDGQFVASTQPIRNYRPGGTGGSPVGIRFTTMWNGKAIFITDANSERILLGTPPATSIDYYAANIAGVAATDGSNIINIGGGFDNMVNQFIDFQGSRYAVGYFRSVNGQSVRYIARSVNGAWTPLTAPNGPAGGIVAATVLGDSLAVLWHEWDAMGATPRVSLWSGSTWEHWPVLPRGNLANSLAAFDGNLHTIVYEWIIGPVVLPVVYRSSGQAWERIDVPAANATAPVLNARPTVAAIGGELVYQNTRGSFVRDGDRWIEQIARDTGKPVDIVDTAGGSALAVNSDGTYERSAQGWVLRAPGTTLLNRTASVNVNGELFVAFISPGLVTLDTVSISSWNGATWALRDVIGGSAQRPIVQVLPSVQSDPRTVTLARDAATNGVLVGGPFLAARNRHDFHVLLNLTPRIVFTQVPAPTRVQPGQTASLAVQVASTGNFTYQWLRGGVAISDGTLATGEVIAGATGPTLTITNATAAINGMYTCTVTPATQGIYCGSETTAPVTLTAERFCDGIDFNNNLVFPEDQDVIDFLSIVSGGGCSPGNTCNDIDFNNNDVFPEDQDVIDFFNTLAGAACP